MILTIFRGIVKKLKSVKSVNSVPEFLNESISNPNPISPKESKVYWKNNDDNSIGLFSLACWEIIS
jgi:hypothetical protein